MIVTIVSLLPSITSGSAVVSATMKVMLPSRVLPSNSVISTQPVALSADSEAKVTAAEISM